MKYVIGGGLAGQIFGFFNNDYLIIDSGKDQTTHKFNLGPRYIEKTSETELLLETLGIDYDSKKINVGYFDKDFCEQSENFKKTYFENSRGDCFNGDKSVLNSGKEILDVIDCSFADLMKELKQKNISRTIFNTVTKISLQSRKLELLGTNKKFNYQEITSTIPLNAFLDVSGKEKLKLKGNSVTFVKLSKDFFNMKGFGFVYFSEKEFYRLSDHGDYLVAEIKDKRERKTLEDIFGDSLLDFACLPTQVQTLKNPPKINGVNFLGRYATWDKSWKLEKIIAKSTERFIKEGELE